LAKRRILSEEVQYRDVFAVLMPLMLSLPNVWHGRMPDRLWRSRGGATAIEMAFLLPVFLGFLLGIEEFGRALWTQTALQYAVEAAARCAAVAPGNCTDVPSYAATQALGLSIPSSAFTYTQDAVCGVCSGVTCTGGAQVTASYAFSGLVPALIPISVTLSAKSCHP
jgi:Flp pilus assembly protein TadG